MFKISIATTLLLFCFISAYNQQQSFYVEQREGGTLFLMSTTRGEEKFNARYLDSEWGVGNLETKDHKILNNVAFKYNVTRDVFEMRAEVNPKLVRRINYAGKVFVHSSYINEFGSVDQGYFELLSEGYAKLLMHFKVKSRPGKKGAYGYEAYQNISKDYFIKVGRSPAVILKKKNEDILSEFSEKPEEASAYVKENKLNLSKKNDLLEFLAYYSSLFVEKPLDN
jgi:hypothetical protein